MVISAPEAAGDKQGESGLDQREELGGGKPVNWGRTQAGWGRAGGLGRAQVGWFRAQVGWILASLGQGTRERDTADLRRA